MYMTR